MHLSTLQFREGFGLTRGECGQVGTMAIAAKPTSFVGDALTTQRDELLGKGGGVELPHDLAVSV